MFTSKLRLTLTTFVVLAGGALVACSSKTSSGGDSTNTDSNEAAASSAQSQHMAGLVFNSVSSADPAMAATSVATGTQLWPAGCVTRAKDASNANLVHVTFNDCTGPFGLVHLNGGVDVAFSAGTTAGTLVAVHTGVNLSANGHPITFSGTADITIAATSRTVQWQGAWERVSNGGETITHTSNLIINVDTVAKCHTANGDAQKTTIGDREVDSTITNYKICETNGIEDCPASGTIVHTHKATGRVVTVTFDGSTEATFSSGSVMVKVPMVCGA